MSQEGAALSPWPKGYQLQLDPLGSFENKEDAQDLTSVVNKETESLRSANLITGARIEPIEKVCEKNLQIKFYIGSGSASPSSQSEDEADSPKIVDSAHLPVHTPTIKRNEHHTRMLFHPKNKSHQFFLASFSIPTKCQQCTSLMVGLIRQGCACDACGFLFHTTCVEKAPRVCPVPAYQQKGPFWRDPQDGLGTAHEGRVWIPKKTGTKKAWQRALAVVCDFKLFLYDINGGKDSQPGTLVRQVIELRDRAFSVSPMWASDLTTIRRKETPCMFNVTASQLSAPSNHYSIPILADSEDEKSKWMDVLSELHRALKKNHFRDRSGYVLREAYDSSLPLIKSTRAAVIVDPKRIALGNEEGLFVVHITIDAERHACPCRDPLSRRLEEGPSDRAHPAGPDCRCDLWTKSPRAAAAHVSLAWMEDQCPQAGRNQGCQAMISGTVCQGVHTCLCVARKSQVLCFELFGGKNISHRKFREVQAPTPIQWLAVFSEQLCVGYQSGFLRYNLRREGAACRMPHVGAPTLSFIAHQPEDALCAVEISSIEFLLCFKSIGVYTDRRGLCSRLAELLWPALPSYCRYSAPYLLVYSKNALDVFNVDSTEWIQTVPLQKAQPLNREGSLNILHLERSRLIYFKNKMANEDELVLPETLTNRQKRMVLFANSKHR